MHNSVSCATALRAWSVLPVCLALTPLLPAGGGDPPRFHLKAMRLLSPGEQAGANAIDDSGRVAGFIQDATVFEVFAAFWDSSGGAPALASGLGANFAIALDLNSAGIAVGSGGEGSVAFKWLPGSEYQALATMGPCCPSAIGINGSGVVVGVSVFGSGGQRPTRWTGNVPEDLGVVAGDATGYCTAITDGGHVVGQSGNEAAQWRGAGAERLSFPGPVLFSIAHGVNEAGDVVGEVSTGGASRAVLWRGGVAEELANLGGSYSIARAISERGWIVGEAQKVPTPAEIGIVAAVWIDGQPHDLNQLTDNMPVGLRLDTARDVNEAGQIVGQGLLFGGIAVAFRLDPIVSSSPWTDLGRGLFGGTGLPVLAGEGTLEPQSPVEIELSSAAANAPAVLVIGASELGTPFAGGILVPNPLVALGLVTDLEGNALALAGTWPDAVPPGTSLYFQAWILDPHAPRRLAATNGLRATAP
jgi:uncharacterized membrane protein